MEITRTANAGVLLTLDGVSILLDGVCQELTPYLATPPQLREQLQQCPPDVLAFTHDHADHFDPDFAEEFQKRTLRPILGPESLPTIPAAVQQLTVGSVKLTAITSRHIGKAGQGTDHVSFVIEGSSRIFFTGDASPLNWDVTAQTPMPKVDVLVANYAYATSEAGWQRIKSSGAEAVVLLHLPEEFRDAFGLWQAVKSTISTAPKGFVHIPQIGRALHLAE